jgi:hypothetical protein
VKEELFRYRDALRFDWLRRLGTYSRGREVGLPTCAPVHLLITGLTTFPEPTQLESRIGDFPQLTTKLGDRRETH